jgi:AraC-like DNA-binding protein
MRYLTQWRMLLARARLLETKDPIASVADNLGYQSEAAFCRAFKREFGQSPGAVRQAAPYA